MAETPGEGKMPLPPGFQTLREPLACPVYHGIAKGSFIDNQVAGDGS